MAKLIGPDFIALQVPDPERAATFCADVLGLERRAHAPRARWCSRRGRCRSRSACWSVTCRSRAHAATAWHCGWRATTRTRSTRTSSPGVSRCSRPPADGPFGRFFAVRDPDGYTLTAHSAPGARP